MLGWLLSSALAFPYVIFFLSVWIIASLAKPWAVVSLVLALLHPQAFVRKLELLATTLHYLILCNDKKWKRPATDPATYFNDHVIDEKDQFGGVAVDRKIVVFVRHGESTWNDTFNKGDRSIVNFVIYFLPNLCKAIGMEWYFWVSGKGLESWFYDSPLSEKGLAQAAAIRKYLQSDTTYWTPKEAAMWSLLVDARHGGNKHGAPGSTAAPPSSQLVSSNLRRAIATLALGFFDRIQATGDKSYNSSQGGHDDQGDQASQDNILILPCLQEISRNPDALAITPPHGQVVPAWTDPARLQSLYQNRIDTRLHTGNKSVSGNGLLRLQEFCRVAFEEVNKDSLIVAGHSLWFRSFFQTYLPYNFEHVCKKKKLVNGGMISFTLLRIAVPSEGPNGNSKSYRYMIDPASLLILYGGF